VLGAVAETLEEQDETIDDLSDCIDGIYDELDELDGGFDEDDFIEVTCPHCGETVYFDEEMIEARTGDLPELQWDHRVRNPGVNAAVTAAAKTRKKSKKKRNETPRSAET
jgi:hypothetical protein